MILVTDGDHVAQETVEDVAKALNLRCISASAGNPTPISGQEIVRLIKKASHDPVLVMFDDRGRRGKGKGETAMEYVATHPDIEVLGAIAVASQTMGAKPTEVDASVAKNGQVVDMGVDKYGAVINTQRTPLVIGDTAEVLNSLNVPVVIGIGDIGKMDKADALYKGSPITKRAIEEILMRNGVHSGVHDGRTE